MKKLAILIGILAVLGLGSGAGATLYTFDDLLNTGVGQAIPDSRYDGTQLGTYTKEGLTLTWTDVYATGQKDRKGNTVPDSTYTGQVVVGGTDNKPLGTQGNALWFYGITPADWAKDLVADPTGNTNIPQTMIFTLSSPASFFAVDYGRPSQGGTIDFAFYLNGGKVYDSGNISYDLTNLPNYPSQTSNYINYSKSLRYDEVRVTASDRWDFDNISITAAAPSVPIPGAVFLFAPGLAALVAVRRRKTK